MIFDPNSVSSPARPTPMPHACQPPCRWALVIAATLFGSACGQTKSGPPTQVLVDDAGVVVVPPDAMRAQPPRPLAVPSPKDEDEVLEDLGALPAWEAVVARSQFLARRGQQGIAYGRLGAVIEIPAADQAEAEAGPANPADAAKAGAEAVEAKTDSANPADPVEAKAASANPADPAGSGAEAEADPTEAADPARSGANAADLVETGAEAAETGSETAEAKAETESLRWLIDETEGEGALAIRIQYDPQRFVLSDDQRVAVWGAWNVDDAQRWYWQATRIEALAPATKALSLRPGMTLPTIAEAPADAVPISTLTSGGQVLFEIRRNPKQHAGGWDVRDPGGKRTVGRLLMPGEHPAYGGMDYRTSDEHWTLAPKTLYTVPARRFRNTRAPGDLPLWRARGVPRRVAP